MPVMAYIESNVKDLPQKGAAIICQIKEGVEAIIIENTNYYYKVFLLMKVVLNKKGMWPREI